MHGLIGICPTSTHTLKYYRLDTTQNKLEFQTLDHIICISYVKIIMNQATGLNPYSFD